MIDDILAELEADTSLEVGAYDEKKIEGIERPAEKAGEHRGGVAACRVIVYQ